MLRRDFVLTFCLLIALIALMSARPAYAYADCSKEYSHVGQRICLERVASETQLELGRVRAALMKRIGSWDQEPRYAQTTSALLSASNASFEKFRRTQCDYEASAAAGGNGAGDRRLQCQSRLNKQYTESLRGQLDWYAARGSP